MNEQAWVSHIERRSDLSTRITHLTKRANGKRAIEVLYEILNSKVIKASKEGFINGTEPVVCFQDMPLHSLAENIKFEEEQRGIERPRYEAFGVRLNKGVMFGKGARPVVYGPSDELKTVLQSKDYWRIVDMDLLMSSNITDWSHEREWRINKDVEFDYSEVEVIVGCPKAYREFIDYYKKTNPALLSAINGIVTLNSMFK